MDWVLATSIAEIIGAIAVVVSLVYVSIQVRANTKATRASSYQAAIQSEMDLASILVEHADIWDKVVSGQPLAEGSELRAGILLFNLLMLDTSRRYQQYAEGYLQAQAWVARRATIPQVVSLPIFPVWRVSLGGRGHTADFLTMIDEFAAGNASGMQTTQAD